MDNKHKKESTHIRFISKSKEHFDLKRHVIIQLGFMNKTVKAGQKNFWEIMISALLSFSLYLMS